MKSSLLHITARTCLCAQLSGMLTGVFVPVIAAAGSEPAAKHKALFSSPSALYVLQDGETVETVARKFGLTVSELKTLNEFRTFSKPFEQLGVGDEIDVPAQKGQSSGHAFAPEPEDAATKGADATFWAGTGTALGTALSGDDPKQGAASMAGNMATGAASAAAQDWLSQFGTARVDLSVDDEFHLDDSSLDFLLPVYDTPQNLFFTQLGYRHKDDRNTVNLGLGYRRFQGGWMYGVNSFYDDDVTGGNRRMGVGFEAWTDYLKLSTNGYFGLTDWHQSRDFEDYDERPADGYDIRAEGWLPAYPQLGGKIVYEKYYGDNVALIDRDTLKHNPVAVTLGVNYTPIPLVTFGIDHQQGEGGDNDTTFNMEINYRLGVPWGKQTDPAMVDSTRTLAGTRYDLVERNNDIVLDYKKQDLIQLGLPDHETGSAGEPGTITAKVNAKYGTQRVEWREDAAFLTAGGRAEPTGTYGEILKITYPAFNNADAQGANTYNISAVAYDTHGNKSNNGTTEITVTQSDARISSLTYGGENAAADGVATDSVTAKVTDAGGNPISGTQVTFVTTGNDVKVINKNVITGADGLAKTTLTSTTAGDSMIIAKVANGTQSGQSVNVSFTDGSATATVNGLVIKHGSKAVASGKAADGAVAVATVQDASGNPLSGQDVTFTVTSGAKATTLKGTTGKDGRAEATVTSATAGTYTVKAALSNGSTPVAADVTFAADGGTAIITRDNLSVGTGAVADGKTTNDVTAIVTDANGNPVADKVVTFHAPQEVTVNTIQGTTGADGKATATLTSRKAGTYKVVAGVDSRVTAQDTSFVADMSTAGITVLLPVSNRAPANGTATDSVAARVADTSGNPVSGVDVTFSATNGATVITETVPTGADGLAKTTLTSTTVGTTTVTATAGDSEKRTDVSFVADSSAAVVSGVTMKHGSKAIASGKAADGAVAVATVQDGSGHLLAGQVVTFTVTQGADINTLKGTTGKEGRAEAVVTTTTAGTYTVSAALNNDSTPATTPATFSADSDTATIPDSSVTANVISAAADGTSADSLTATVTDANGNPVSGQVVNFSVSKGATVTPTATSDANGKVSASVTSTTAGTYTVKMWPDGKRGEKASATVYFLDAENIGSVNLSHTFYPNKWGVTDLYINFTPDSGNRFDESCFTVQGHLTYDGGHSSPPPPKDVPVTHWGTTNTGYGESSGANEHLNLTVTNACGEPVSGTVKQQWRKYGGGTYDIASDHVDVAGSGK